MNKKDKARLDKIEETLRRHEARLQEAYIAFRKEWPITDYEQVPLSHWPDYTKQQLWFFDAEVTRWKNSCSTRPGFAICSFSPGVALHPLLFLPINVVIKIMLRCKQAMEQTKCCDDLIEEHYKVLKEFEQIKSSKLFLKNLLS